MKVSKLPPALTNVKRYAYPWCVPFLGSCIIENKFNLLLRQVNNHGGLYCSPLYGGPGGFFWNDGTYSGIRRITVRENQHTLTSLRLDYGIEGDINVKDRDIRGVRHGGTDGTKIVVSHNCILVNL
jgi:hypothetical protein